EAVTTTVSATSVDIVAEVSVLGFSVPYTVAGQTRFAPVPSGSYSIRLFVSQCVTGAASGRTCGTPILADTASLVVSAAPPPFNCNTYATITPSSPAVIMFDPIAPNTSQPVIVTV